MQHRIFKLTFVILAYSCVVLSQTNHRPSAFIAAHMGGFLSTREDFRKVYGSQLGFVYGATLALPLSAEAYLYGKATYFSTTGVPIIYNYNYQNGVLVSITESRDGVANFKQWIFNIGSLVNLSLSENLLVGISGGLTYSRISEKQYNAQGTIASSLNGGGILGLFTGVGLERRFSESQFSLFVEAQYNYAWPIISSVGRNDHYSGLNLSSGIRFYFRDRRMLNPAGQPSNPD